jgi:hypothetical protein
MQSQVRIAASTVAALSFFEGCGSSGPSSPLDGGPDVPVVAQGDGAAPSYDAPSDSMGAPGPDSAPTDASIDTATDAPQDAVGMFEAGGSSCRTAADCRMFSNYCGGCTCDALAKGATAPICDAGMVSCLLDPCANHSAACSAGGQCFLH